MRHTAIYLAALIASTWISAGYSQIQTTNSKPDPYRNFVGSWSGTIPVNNQTMPNTVKVVVSETQDGKSMRWDYVFGVKGEKGYAHDTKWISFDLANSMMTTHWKHKDELDFRTQGLNSLIQTGFGTFSAVQAYVNSGLDRVTFELQPETLSYLWETSRDGKSYSVYSKFVFRRDPVARIQSSATNNKE